jgi:hypothetical protein
MDRIAPDLISPTREMVERVKPVIYYLNILDTIENMHSVVQRCVWIYSRGGNVQSLSLGPRSAECILFRLYLLAGVKALGFFSTPLKKLKLSEGSL